MGLSPFIPDWNETPSPHRFACSTIQESYSQDQDCTVVELKYSDYNRVMVLAGRWNGGYLDPHFKENKRILARFPATKEGYETALAFVAFMGGGECAFDRVPGYERNIIGRG